MRNELIFNEEQEEAQREQEAGAHLRRLPRGGGQLLRLLYLLDLALFLFFLLLCLLSFSGSGRLLLLFLRGAALLRVFFLIDLFGLLRFRRLLRTRLRLLRSRAFRRRHGSFCMFILDRIRNTRKGKIAYLREREREYALQEPQAQSALASEARNFPSPVGHDLEQTAHNALSSYQSNKLFFFFDCTWDNFRSTLLLARRGEMGFAVSPSTLLPLLCGVGGFFSVCFFGWLSFVSASSSSLSSFCFSFVPVLLAVRRGDFGRSWSSSSPSALLLFFASLLASSASST